MTRVESLSYFADLGDGIASLSTYSPRGDDFNVTPPSPDRVLDRMARRGRHETEAWARCQCPYIHEHFPDRQTSRLHCLTKAWLHHNRRFCGSLYLSVPGPT